MPPSSLHPRDALPATSADPSRPDAEPDRGEPTRVQPPAHTDASRHDERGAHVDRPRADRLVSHGGAARSTSVLVDALSAQVGGGMSYLVAQLRALEAVAPHLELRVLAAPDNADALLGALRSPVRVVRNGALRPVYEQTVLAARGPADGVLYCPGNFAPVLGSRRATVLTLQNPNYFGSGRRAPHNRRLGRRLRSRLSRWSALHADRLVVISQSLLDEVRADLPAVADRAVLIQSGAPEWPDVAIAPMAVPGDLGPFLLSLANDAPHKHLDLTVDAWIEAFAGVRSADDAPALVMAGRYFADERQQAQRARVPHRLRTRFLQLGAVTDRREVRWLLEHAVALVAASTLEAHPLTPAEAGSLGCPLVLSDIPPHREVAGAHATFVRPGSRHELVAALRAVRLDEIARVPWTWPYSWEDNARSLAAVLEGAIR